MSIHSPESASPSLIGPLMIGLTGLRLEAGDITRLQHPLTGGVILFRRNFKSRDQLSQLIQAIRALQTQSYKTLLIAVDQEGGRVQRFKADGFTRLPAMRELGKVWDQDPKDPKKAEKAARAVGYLLAAELRAYDLDFSFAPVLDLDYGYGPQHVIGDRALHRDPKVVAQLASSQMEGMASAGMPGTVGKHFPGHGFVEGDSHRGIPIDARPLEEIQHDREPYQRARGGLAAVMVAWVIYSQVDSTNAAAFSKKWLEETLRGEMQFKGAIFSDALGMEGARQGGRSPVQAAEAALTAGCDMVICENPDAVDQLLKALNHRPNEASSNRLLHLKPNKNPLSWDELHRDPQYIAARDLIEEIFSNPALASQASA